MPNENATILIIDNSKIRQEGGAWVTLAQEYGVSYETVFHDTKEEILADLEKKFRDDPALVFVGTVLDLIYRGQTRGGIELWEQMEHRGLDAKCGHLLVTTKTDADEVVEFVKKRDALLSTSTPLEHKRPVFKRLLRRCGLIQ